MRQQKSVEATSVNPLQTTKVMERACTLIDAASNQYPQHPATYTHASVSDCIRQADRPCRSLREQSAALALAASKFLVVRPGGAETLPQPRLRADQAFKTPDDRDWWEVCAEQRNMLQPGCHAGLGYMEGR